MHIREFRPGDEEYFSQHLHSDITKWLAKQDKEFFEMVPLEEHDHILVIEDEEGNCASMMMIQQLEEDEEDTAFTWLIPGSYIEKHFMAFLRLTRNELGRRILDAGPYRMVWSYVNADRPKNIAWATRGLGGEIVERNLKVKGLKKPRHKVILTREMLERRKKYGNS